MKITHGQLRHLIREALLLELTGKITGKEKGMSLSANPTPGMTGLEVGDIVYLDRDTYLDADIFPFGDDFPPVTVIELGDMEQLIGTTVPSDKSPLSDWDWVAGATGPAFVGSYEPAPGLPTEDLVFPISAIDWDYTRRGPKEPWQTLDKGTFAG
tara:strand:+ start:503 stop:967 length:465 start_codon:yes stop_codon:yes gene_type:complete